MHISGVTHEDGKSCIVLINALNAARFADVSGKDLDAIVASKKWLSSLALQMAEQLKKPSASISPTEGFRVKSMGKNKLSRKK